MPVKRRPTPVAPCTKRARATEVVDPLVAKRAVVARTLAAAAEKDVAAMLSEMLPFLFEQPRHKYQERMVEMIATMLSEHEIDLRATVAELESVATHVVNERSIRESAVRESVAASEQRLTLLQEANVRLERCKLTSKIAKGELGVAQSVQSDVVSRVDDAIERKLKLELVLQLQQALECEDIDNVPKRRHEAEQLRKKMSLFLHGKNVLNAVQLALSKLRDARGAFDAMLLGEARAELNNMFEEVSPIVDGGHAAKAECQSKVDVCQTTLNCHNQALADIEVEHSNMKARKHESDAAVRVAKENLVAMDIEMTKSNSDLAVATDSLANLLDGASSVFAELNIGTKQVEMVQAPEVTAMNCAALGC